MAERPESRTVVITGYGTVGPHGCGREALRSAFEQGPPAVREVDRSSGYHRSAGSRFAALVDPAELGTRLSPRQARRMSPPSRFAVVAARLALEEAGIPGEPGPPMASTAVVTSTSYGPSSYTEDLLKQIFLDAPTSASPFLFTEAVANAPAAQIALAVGARGPNVTVTQRQAGPLLALARGAKEVASGRSSRALVAAVDEVNPLLHAALDRFGVLAGSRRQRSAAHQGEARELARPFDRNRHGFVIAEGATALVLEPESTAVERGAPILARVVTHVAGFDPHAPAAGYGRDPETLARALEVGLGRCRGSWRGRDDDLPTPLAPGDLDLIVAGACGSQSGDALEARVIRRLWGEHPLPPILAPKASTGEHGGGLLAGAMLALEGSDFAPTAGFETPDPRLDLRPFEGGSLPERRRILLSALAVGGAAAWTVLEGHGPGSRRERLCCGHPEGAGPEGSEGDDCDRKGGEHGDRA